MMRNKYSLCRNIILALLMFPFSYRAQNNSDSPIEVSKRVADKIIRETSFQFILSPKTAGDGIQSLDFDFEFGKNTTGAAYALSYIHAEKEATVKIGLSHSSPVKVWINDNLVYSGKNKTGNYSEDAYDFYHFPEEISLPLNPGNNKILIKSLLDGGENVFHSGVLKPDNFIMENITWSVTPANIENSGSCKWLVIGPFNSSGEDDFEKIFAPETGFLKYYGGANSFLTWQLPKTRLTLKDVIAPETSFKSHSYFEWHYANGQTMLAMTQLANKSNENKYLEHVKKYCSVALDNYEYFKYQFQTANDKTGFNYRVYRKAMLDDSSAPALPFIELYNNGYIPESEFLINIIADYISNGQTRLNDGTLCRPEPEPSTIWADDLFMGVPFLLRYAAMSGNDKYYDDASRQVVNFFKYLFDKEKGLCFHSWFGQKQKNSGVHWGRANGWMAWAVSEALIHLPKSNKNYKNILAVYKKQMEGLVKYQDKSGMWHQVLDRPDSYEETSCTAMFTLALARGIRNGWINKKYNENVMKAWAAITNKIDADGTVNGICQGTGIGDDLEFYFNRKTPLNDPRGLGAVITAGVEVQALIDSE